MSENNQVLNSIKRHFKGLLFKGADEYPYKVFRWNDGNRDFSISKLLSFLGFFQLIQANNFQEDVLSHLGDISAKYLEVIQLLKENSLNIYFLRITSNDLSFQNDYYQGIAYLYVVVCKLNNGIFLTFSTKINDDIRNIENQNNIITCQYENTERDNWLNILLERIYSLLNVYSFPYPEKLYPFDNFLYEISNNRDIAIDKILISCCFVEVLTLGEHLINFANEDYIQETRKAFDLLRDELDDIRVFKVGLVERDVFIVGRDKDGSYIIVSTVSVES